jgi:hypothetical protein
LHTAIFVYTNVLVFFELTLKNKKNGIATPMVEFSPDRSGIPVTQWRDIADSGKIRDQMLFVLLQKKQTAP